MPDILALLLLGFAWFCLGCPAEFEFSSERRSLLQCGAQWSFAQSRAFYRIPAGARDAAMGSMARFAAVPLAC